ncbi:MAG: F-type H+-transporting ATPase subunit delta [Patescibacteria group bacterium]|nr:F-type H+-transporting ATPase subunit delta [Patescibacteria group bacterium]
MATATQRTELARVIATMMQKQASSKQLARQIAAYLVQEHQTKDLDLILRDVLTARARDGVIEANLTTAFPLSAGVKAEVKQLLKNEYPAAKQFVLDETVEPQVLSGIKVQTADKQLDQTAQAKLDKLTRKF